MRKVDEEIFNCCRVSTSRIIFFQYDSLFSNLMIFFSFRKCAMMRFKFIESNLGPLVFTKHLEKKFTSVPSDFVRDRQKVFENLVYPGLNLVDLGTMGRLCGLKLVV